MGARGEIVGAKSHLKSALSLSSLAGENHLRALLLMQVGAQYLHTAPVHAMEMLAVCEMLGAVMGVKQKDVDGVKGGGKGKEKETKTEGSDGSLGNTPLRLWVGERFLAQTSTEIFKHTNKPHQVAKQEVYNAMYRGAVEGMMGSARWPSAMESDHSEMVPTNGGDVKMQSLDPDQDVEMQVPAPFVRLRVMEGDLSWTLQFPAD
ncbi:uncharacterized protein F5147DRAFT_820855 [Suillus discolor]|uniref:Uncharacterized protein n=1 Tax=Suillus discolor TaxID=1912936 RepID=A0A9P7EVM7_9AGAM|nr:uncharacterized protein F5147DRAFT_820855 [Suillus discolor]KAG2093713.1 hypothetical protein F5147DRAFT_820855 [Suillus discolor]